MQADAVASCEECGKAICSACKKTIDRGTIRTTPSGHREEEHSYHTVCPECEAKFKTRVKNTKKYALIGGAIGLIAILIWYFMIFKH